MTRSIFEGRQTGPHGASFAARPAPPGGREDGGRADETAEDERTQPPVLALSVHGTIVR